MKEKVEKHADGKVKLAKEIMSEVEERVAKKL